MRKNYRLSSSTSELLTLTFFMCDWKSMGRTTQKVLLALMASVEHIYRFLIFFRPASLGFRFPLISFFHFYGTRTKRAHKTSNLIRRDETRRLSCLAAGECDERVWWSRYKLVGYDFHELWWLFDWKSWIFRRKSDFKVHSPLQPVADTEKTHFKPQPLIARKSMKSFFFVSPLETHQV